MLLTCHFQEDAEARDRAQDAVVCTLSYDEAVKLLQSYNDNNRLLHRYHLDQFLLTEQSGCKGKDLDKLQMKMNSVIKGLGLCRLFSCTDSCGDPSQYT